MLQFRHRDDAQDPLIDEDDFFVVNFDEIDVLGGEKTRRTSRKSHDIRSDFEMEGIEPALWMAGDMKLLEDEQVILPPPPDIHEADNHQQTLRISDGEEMQTLEIEMPHMEILNEDKSSQGNKEQQEDIFVDENEKGVGLKDAIRTLDLKYT